MTQSSEQRFLDFLKVADSPDLVQGTTDHYEDQPEIEPKHNIEPVNFTDTAQASSKDVREGVPGRLLQSKDQVLARERALVGAILNTRDFETSSINLKPVEKVSSPTLMERVLSTAGRL
jgi:hypothetical protein